MNKIARVDGLFFFALYTKLLLEFEAMKLTKPSKEMNKKKRRNFVDADIGQILIITKLL